MLNVLFPSLAFLSILFCPTHHTPIIKDLSLPVLIKIVFLDEDQVIVRALWHESLSRRKTRQGPKVAEKKKKKFILMKRIFIHYYLLMLYINYYYLFIIIKFFLSNLPGVRLRIPIFPAQQKSEPGHTGRIHSIWMQPSRLNKRK